MKLLLDQNLSFKLVYPLRKALGDALHVNDVGLSSAGDDVIWQYAGTHGCMIVSKDSDFAHRAMLYGAPPKIIRIRIGNASTRDILRCMEDHAEEIRLFEHSEESILVLS